MLQYLTQINFEENYIELENKASELRLLTVSVPYYWVNLLYSLTISD